MDELKKYLQSNREALDNEEPGELLWERIVADEPPVKKGRVISIGFKIAAAATLIAGIAGAYLLLDRPSEGSIIGTDIFKESLAVQPMSWQPEVVTEAPDTTSEYIVAPPKTIKKRSIDKRYMMMESFTENYGQLVKYQMNNIRSTPVYAENPGYFIDFKTRLHQMDQDEKVIRTNIKENGITNTLLDQLINVYQQKLDVLKSLQSEINKMNARVLQHNDAADSSNKYYLNL